MTTKGQVVIPVAIRRRHKIEKGTEVCFFERGGEIIMQPVTDEFIDSLCGFVKGGGGVRELERERRREREREDREIRMWAKKGRSR